MNRLIIVGNGFDKSLGMKTGYGDFLDYLFKKYKDEFCYSGNISSSRLIEISSPYQGFSFGERALAMGGQEFYNLVKDHSQFRINYRSNLFKRIVNLWEANWVDIEMEFFNELERAVRFSKEDEIKDLLDDFDELKKELEIYLNSLQVPMSLVLPEEYKNLFDPFGISKENSSYNYPFMTLVLNFNYTSALSELLGSLLKSPKHKLIPIHGELMSGNNPIVFGFGDEHDHRLKTIEPKLTLEANRRIKSYSYMLTKSYSILRSFLDSKFEAHVLGHSLGLSDRTLLKEIFGSLNCKKIQIHFHDKGNGENDFFEKCVALNSHFDNKVELRNKVVDFTQLRAMPQFVTR